MFQDAWDSRRDTQVKTYMTVDSNRAFATFNAAVAEGIERTVKDREQARKEGASKGAVIWTHVCGSYIRTDIPERDDKDPIHTFVRQAGTSTKSVLTKMLNKNNIILVKKGCYTTGTLHFEDGSMQVADPTKGIMLSSESRKLVAIKPVETIYCWLLATI
jgi:redox-sensitive bicupin YhaK (pirin superfamily)